MNGTHSIQVNTGGFIPEMIIDDKDITKAGFVEGAVFKIEPYQDELVTTLVFNEGGIG